MEQKIWQGFIQPTAYHACDDGLRIALTDGASMLLPTSLPDFVWCRDLILRHLQHGLPIWLRSHGDTIEKTRFVHVAMVLQLTPEPLGGAFILFSDCPNSQYLPDNHPRCEALLEVFSTSFCEGQPVVYALEEDGLIADAEPLPAQTEGNGAMTPAARQQTPV